MTKPLVSICIPVYNGEQYLKECLDSCISQSYADYEIIICDDGSTDGSISLVEDYARKEQRIRFFKNEQNLGLVGNWNKCIDLAKGEWIKFVFQDDYISQDCLTEFVSAASNDVKLVVSERNFILPTNANENTKNYYSHTVRTLKNTNNNTSHVYSPKLISTIAIQNMAMNFIAEPSLIFFRKAVVSELGLFNPNLKQICDLEFALRIASVYGLKYIPKKLCFFRIHEQTTTNTNITSNYFELRYIEPLLLSYFLLYDNSFKSFRKNLGLFYSLKLKMYFKVKAFIAYEANKRESKEHSFFKKAGNNFREIEMVKNGSFFIRLIASFLSK